MTRPPAAAAMRASTTVILLLILFLPTTVFYLGIAGSLALGSAAAALSILLLCIVAPRALTSAVIDGAAIGGIASLALATHLLIASLWGPVDYPRAFGSFLILFLVILGSLAASLIITHSAQDKFDKTMHIAFWAMVAAGTLGALGLVPIPSPVARAYERPAFPFTEPSHFALCMAPIFLYCAVMSPRLVRASYLAIVLVLIVALQSLTLAVSWVLVAVICARGIVVPMAISAMAAITYYMIDFEYYLDRLQLGSDTDNLSSLVYLQGWELVEESLMNSSYWGIGFQQLGVFGTDVPLSRVLYVLVGDYANILDGGFNLAKMLSELGVFGFGIAAYLTYLAIRGFFMLRRAAIDPFLFPSHLIFAYSTIVAYMIELFVRGAGYFTSTGFLLLTALHVRYWYKRNRAAWGEADKRQPRMQLT